MAYTYIARIVVSQDKTYVAAGGYWVLGLNHAILSASDVKTIIFDVREELINMDIDLLAVKFFPKGIGSRVFLTIKFTSLKDELKFVKRANLGIKYPKRFKSL